MLEIFKISDILGLWLREEPDVSCRAQAMNVAGCVFGILAVGVLTSAYN